MAWGRATAAGCLDAAGGDGDDGTAATLPGTTGEHMTLTFESPAFADGEQIPTKYTADGADVSPPLTIGGAPDEAATYALVVDDPDAPGRTFTHWLLWNVPADRTEVPEGVPTTRTVESLGGGRQGENDFGEVGYRGPKPPTGDGPHTYRFTLYVLRRPLEVPAGAGKPELVDAIDGTHLARARFTGEYER